MSRRGPVRYFPLGDYIDEHADLPHSLGPSGMRYQLRTTDAVLARRPRLAPDEDELRAAVAQRLRVDADRVLLTHGATESASLALLYLSTMVRREAGRAPTFHSPRPEYPPLVELAGYAGFAESGRPVADLLVRSDPHNPTGHRWGEARLRGEFGGCRRWLIDETFREFSAAPSLAASDATGIWTTGTLTKAFGADAVRVGWIVPAREDLDAFRRFHGIAADEIPLVSVGLARELLARADAVLGEVRRIVDRNRAILMRELPEVGYPEAPVAFDRPGILDTEPFCRHALDEGLLLCPGHFFGDPSGIRIGFPRRSFPRDFALYRRLRAEHLGGAVSRGATPATPPRLPAGRRGAARRGRPGRRRSVRRAR